MQCDWHFDAVSIAGFTVATDRHSDTESAPLAGPSVNGTSAVEAPSSMPSCEAHWRIVIVAGAFALPLVSIALEQATRAFPDSAFGYRLLYIPPRSERCRNGLSMEADFLGRFCSSPDSWPSCSIGPSSCSQYGSKDTSVAIGHVRSGRAPQWLELSRRAYPICLLSTPRFQPTSLGILVPAFRCSVPFLYG